MSQHYDHVNMKLPYIVKSMIHQVNQRDRNIRKRYICITITESQTVKTNLKHHLIQCLDFYSYKIVKSNTFKLFGCNLGSHSIFVISQKRIWKLKILAYIHTPDPLTLTSNGLSSIVTLQDHSATSSPFLPVKHLPFCLPTFHPCPSFVLYPSLLSLSTQCWEFFAQANCGILP